MVNVEKTVDGRQVTDLDKSGIARRLRADLKTAMTDISTKAGKSSSVNNTFTLGKLLDDYETKISAFEENGCLKFIKQAKKAIQDKNVEEKNTSLVKTQNIIHEFMVTLNMDVKVSSELMVMYDYIHRRLVEANVKNDTVILEEVEGLVTELRDTWKQVIQLNRQQQFVNSEQA